MLKIKDILETICICVALMFFSKEVINSKGGRWKKELDNCGVSL
jgi:hypothetical protein